MNKNFVMLAQNSNYDYITQACACALSIHLSNKDANISLITNDPVPDEYKQLFDHIIPIPWGDLAEKHDWKIHNRWKILHVLPYENAIVLDTDMLVLNDIGHWFDFLSQYNLFFTSRVKTYRNNWAQDNFYRKRFIKHGLPNLYSGLHYLTKDPFAYEFNSVVDKIVQNWKDFAGHIQKDASMDIAVSLAAKIIGCEEQITNNKIEIPTFVHMKANIQDWDKILETWQNKIGVYFTENCDLWIGNYKQHDVFHYTEKTFLTEEIIDSYKKKLGI